MRSKYPIVVFSFTGPAIFQTTSLLEFHIRMDWLLLLAGFFAPAGIAIFLSRFAPSRFDRDIARRRAFAKEKQPEARVQVVGHGPMIGALGDHPLYSHLLADVAFGTKCFQMVSLAFDGIVNSDAEARQMMTSMPVGQCIAVDGRVIYRSPQLLDLRDAVSV